MAVRRTLIDVIDRGLNPNEAHTKLDKKGRLIDSRADVVAPVIVPEVKETVEPVKASTPNLLTEETDETKEDKKETKPEAKAAPVMPKKQDKSSKPA